MVRRKPIAATASIQPQQARTCGKIPIAPAAPPLHTSRDFVPWRFLDAGRNTAWIVSASRRPKTCTKGDIADRSRVSLLDVQNRTTRLSARKRHCGPRENLACACLHTASVSCRTACAICDGCAIRSGGRSRDRQSEFTAAKTRLINLRVAEREGNLIEYAEAESVIDQVSGITCLIIRGRALIPRTGAGGTRVGFGYQDNGPTR